MNQEPEKKVKEGRSWILWIAAALVLCIAAALIGLAVSRKYESASMPLVITISLLCVALLAGFWMLVRRLGSWRNARRALMGLACFATLIAVFYTVENWRGKRAWENAKRKVEAEGTSLDWNALIPPPIADEQNIFKAPRMQGWFVGRGATDLSKRMNLTGFKQPYDLVVEVVVSTPENPVPTTVTDIKLNYRPPFLTMTAPHAEPRSTPASAIPLIEYKDIPLADAISNLARQADIHYELDPKLHSAASPKGAPLLKSKVSLRWENLSARAALLALLNNYGWLLVENPDGTARITSKDPLQVVADDSAKETLARLVERASATNAAIATNASGRSVRSCREFVFVAGPPNPTSPTRIVVHAPTMAQREEIEKFFAPVEANRISMQSAGSNSFRLVLKSGAVCDAADYLAWSDQFEPDFDLMREALKRPYARMPGDYSEPFSIPIPNFINIRVAAQTLADRAKCFMLTDRPDEALRELTLINDMRRMLEGKPTGKPMTLIAAMINVAVAGLYVDTIADGFRLHAWREPQLAALQRQLQQINVAPPVLDALRQERVGLVRQLEVFGLGRLMSMPYSDPKTWKEKIAQLKRRAYDLVPRGWVYQNMVTIVNIQPVDKFFDPVRNVAFPPVADEFTRGIESQAIRSWPFRLAVSVAIPNYKRALQTMSRNQSFVNQALIACALERYRLANGGYPDSLDALAPQFLETVPHDLIGGGPLKYRRIASPQNSTGENFLLYSIGWNETDDGGQVILEKVGGQSFAHGDWVWGVPPRQ